MNLIVAVFALLCLSHTAQAAQNWTGDGGKGMSITILAPQATGLAKEQNYIPALIQGEFVSNFSSYSAIDVLDWQRREAIIVHIMTSPSYSDSVQAQTQREIGNLIPTTHFMDGKITKTTTGYNLQMSVIKTSDKMTIASFSKTFTFDELDNLTGVRQTSLELLQQIGVTLTAKAQEELAVAAVANHVAAQTALARGVTAQRQGTEVAALSYFFQAATLDPSLVEAVKRSSIIHANISSGNIGEDARNDIAWRRAWVERLAETERFFDNFLKTNSMPFTLFYSDDIKQTAINYQNETVTLSIETHLHGNGSWVLPLERTIQTVWDGLHATERKRNWELNIWPNRRVTNLDPFKQETKFSVSFELLNSQNKVIGREKLNVESVWRVSQHAQVWSNHDMVRPWIEIKTNNRRTLNFRNVNANDITDKMAIRIASVNNVDARTAAKNGIMQMRALTKDDFNRNTIYAIDKGSVVYYAGNDKNIVIPKTVWEEPVTSIATSVFSKKEITSVNIHNGVTYIGDWAFFEYSDRATLTSITIGANVSLSETRPFEGDFRTFYYQNGRKAGTYNGTITGYNRNSVIYSWTYSP